MSLWQSVRKWWVESQGGEVVRDFGTIDSAASGRTSYEASARLRKGEEGYCLTLQMKKTKAIRGRQITVRSLRFYDMSGAASVFEDAQRRMDNREGPSGEKLGPFLSKMLALVGQEVVRNYGAIDYNPKGNTHRRVELALLTGGDGYRLWISEGGRSHYDWPASLVQPLISILREVRSHLAS